MKSPTHQNGAADAARSSETLGPANRVRKNLAGLTHDVIGLAELQARLFAMDTGELAKSSKLAAIMVGVAAVLALGSLPVLLFALGWGLASLTTMNLALSLLLSALIGGLLPAVCLAWFGISHVMQHLTVLNRSRDEFSRNLAWLKRTMQTQSGR